MTTTALQREPLPPPPPFAVRIEEERGHVRVHVIGELDAYTASSLTDALDGLEDGTGVPVQRRADVELDLSRLSFLDSTGVSALADSRLALRNAGWHLRLVRAQPHIGRLLAYAAAAGWLAEDALEVDAASA